MLAASAGAMDKDVHIRKVNKDSFCTDAAKHLHYCRRQRFRKSRYTANLSSIAGERPFQPVNVGPGVGTGYDSEGVGGFQQFNVRDAATPLNVDSLRIIGNEKQVYNGRVTGVTQQSLCVEIKRAYS
jgi:hypothetical protein